MTAFPPVRWVRRRSLPSTQDLARRLAERGSPAWTVILAGRQTRGRGRMDRRWSSGRGGLYFSVLLRPGIRPAALPKMSLEAGRLFARVLARETGLRMRVKPPNDVLALAADGKYRKVCGILIEAAGGETRLDWVVIGVGLNVSNRIPRGLPEAGSLRALSGKPLRREALLEALLAGLRRAWKDR